MEDVTCVIIGGYYNSGSSAVVDLLKEYAGTYNCGNEIRFINDPYGLISLENNLVENWDWIRAAMALDDFWNFSKKCARSKSRFPFAPFGMGYKNINKDYLKITKKFIERLTEFTYDGDFYAYKAKDNYFSYVMDRCRLGIEIYTKNRIPIHKKRMVGHSHPTREKYEELVKEYMNELFCSANSETETKYVVLDQAVHPQDSAVVNRYFYKAKMIIVDRNPKDMFIQSAISDAVYYSNTEQSGYEFISLQKALHEKNKNNNSNILYILFEDLVQKYDATVCKIEEFLNLKPEDHIKYREFFNPDVSKRNIGIWKKYYSKYSKALDIISVQERIK